MRFVFLMDPLETVIPEKDTTYFLMCCAKHRGHDIYYMAKDGISLDAGCPVFDVTQVVPRLPDENPSLFDTVERVSFTAGEVDAVFIRTDPPFDSRYLMHTWLLDAAAEQTCVINSPRGVRSCNEKVWCSRLPGLTPKTLVTARRDRFDAFLAEQRKVIVKPTDQYGGKGVFVVNRGDTNATVIFETLSEGGSREIIVQEYVDAAEVGDKRILLLDGEPLGAIFRVHGDSDHRNNLFAGGKALPAAIDEDDMRIIEHLRPLLRQLGLHFVGIDVIGGRLIEVNVTSPTCLVEMTAFDKADYDERIIEYVEKLAAGF